VRCPELGAVDGSIALVMYAEAYRVPVYLACGDYYIIIYYTVQTKLNCAAAYFIK